jgi:methylglutaconyl-CoA hydratase
VSAALVNVDVADGLATITLADVDHRNRLSRELMSALDAALRRVATDASIRAAVLTAAGPVFCAGADLDGFGDDAPQSLRELLTGLAALPMPTIARVNGDAYGGGLGLIAACDLAIALTTAKFAFAEVRLGVTAAVIAEHCLRVMRPRPAAELMLTGTRVDAEAMTQAGLLTRSVPDLAAMDEQVGAWVDSIRLGGPHAVAATKQVLRRVPELGTDVGDWAAALSAERFASAEAAEGIAAFRERRLPDWAPKPP